MYFFNTETKLQNRSMTLSTVSLLINPLLHIRAPHEHDVRTSDVKWAIEINWQRSMSPQYDEASHRLNNTSPK